MDHHSWENYFRNVPSSRAAFETLCREGCDPGFLRDAVCFILSFESQARVVRIDRRACDQLVATLESAVTQLNGALESDWSRLLSLPPSAVDTQTVRDLAKLKKLGKLEQSGGCFFRASNTERAGDSAKRKNGNESLEPSKELASLPERMRLAAAYFRRVSEYAEPGKARKHTEPLAEFQSSDMALDALMRYVRRRTKRARYREIANLFPGGASGAGKYGEDSLKQRPLRRRNLPRLIVRPGAPCPQSADTVRTQNAALSPREAAMLYNP